MPMLPSVAALAIRETLIPQNELLYFRLEEEQENICK